MRKLGGNFGYIPAAPSQGELAFLLQLGQPVRPTSAKSLKGPGEFSHVGGNFLFFAWT